MVSIQDGSIVSVSLCFFGSRLFRRIHEIHVVAEFLNSTHLQCCENQLAGKKRVEENGKHARILTIYNLTMNGQKEEVHLVALWLEKDISIGHITRPS